MSNNVLLIGVAVGVFLIGLGIGYAISQATTTPTNFSQMTPQQMQQMMRDPNFRQQMMNEWRQNPQMMQDWAGPMMNDPQIMNSWMNNMMQNPQPMNQWMAQNPQMMGPMMSNHMQNPQHMQLMMQTMSQNPQIMNGWMNQMMQNQQFMQQMMNNTQFQQNWMYPYMMQDWRMGPGMMGGPTWPQGTGTLSPVKTNEVTIPLNAWHPANIEHFKPLYAEVESGTTVTWTNTDSIVHTVTHVNNSFDSKPIQPNESWSYTFDTAGVYDYYCTLHPYMKGTVKVD